MDPIGGLQFRPRSVLNVALWSLRKMVAHMGWGDPKVQAFGASEGLLQLALVRSDQGIFDVVWWLVLPLRG